MRGRAGHLSLYAAVMQRNCFRPEVPNVLPNVGSVLKYEVRLLKERSFLPERSVIYRTVWHLGIESVSVEGVI